MTELRHPTRASALIAALVVALLVTMVGSGFAAPGHTTLVSVGSSGEQGNLDSSYASITADGRYVAFVSSADNLVEDDTNGVVDVFVRDLQKGTTERVSVDNNGNQQNDQQQRDGSTFCGLEISSDGRYVAFSSAADNLVPNDTNASCDVYMRDLQEATTERVSVDGSGGQANGDSWEPSISADGRYVAFHHGPDDLAGNDPNERYDVYVRDLREATTERVSVDSSGNPISGGSYDASISADGRYVAFDSTASNLVPNSNGGVPSVFVRDLQQGTTEKVSVDSSGNQGNAEAFNSSMSADGRYVAFSSYADNLVPNDGNGSSADVFIRERQVQDAVPQKDDTRPGTAAPTADLATLPDTTSPTADIVTPSDGAVYIRNQTVGADYSCEDEVGGSDLKSCAGAVPKYQPIETDSLGDKTFTVRATDNAGNVSSVSSTYTVAECHITGTPGDEVLEGTAGYDRICGLGGNDTLKGLGGNDELVGGTGDDTLDGGPGTDAAHFTSSPRAVTASLVTGQATGDGYDQMAGIENLIGSNHDDTLIGSGSKNHLSGGGGVDQLFGLEGVDRLVGGTQDDALRGGAGDDRVVANGGSDGLFGEEGSDSLDSKDGVEGNDALDGGTGTDTCSTDPIEESIASCEQ